MALYELSRFSPATRQLVQDARYRASLTSDLLRSDPSSSESIHARDAIDAAVVEILVAVGLPRGPINGPIVDHVGRGWFGRKAEDCRLLIDTWALGQIPEANRADSLLRTWMHESLHARQPYHPGFQAEWRDFRGFEEGVVEGLTRRVTVELLGLQPLLLDYHPYVAAYRALARTLDLEVERLWRQLWTVPAGGIGHSLVDGLERSLAEHGRAPLNALRRQRIAILARRLFATERGREQPDVEVLMATWKQVIG